MAWLGTWDKRIPVVIDASSISADATHFPVPIVISPNAGITEADTSVVMDEVGSDWQKIAVTKADGETQLYVEKEMWRTSGLLEYTGSTVRKDQVTASNGQSTCYKAFDGKLEQVYDAGDTDATAGWKVTNGAQSDGTCWIQWDFDNVKTISQFRMAALPILTTRGFPHHVAVYGSHDPSFTGEETDLGDYYLSQPADRGEYCSWETLTTTGDFRYLRIEILTQRAISGGTDNGEMYVAEVEFNETVPGYGLLWVSKSDWTIDATDDTELYIYYDSAQSDNTTYVAAAGGRTEVWDSTFKLRYGMSQDPSGSSPQITDSTSNNTDGTTSGSMTSGDLVESDMGYAIDFDGSNDYIVAGPNAATAALTTAIIYTTLTVDSVDDSKRIIGAKEDEETGIWIMAINEKLRVYDYVVSDSYASSADVLEAGETFRIVQVIGATSYVCYVNGSSVISLSPISIDLSTMTDWELKISDSLSPFDGTIRDVRLQSSLPATSWLDIDELAQSDSLLTFGEEEAYADRICMGEVTTSIDCSPTTILDSTGNTVTVSIEGEPYHIVGSEDVSGNEVTVSIEGTSFSGIVADTEVTVSVETSGTAITPASDMTVTVSATIEGPYQIAGTCDASDMTVTTSVELIPFPSTIEIDFPAFEMEAHFGGAIELDFPEFSMSSEIVASYSMELAASFPSFSMTAYCGGFINADFPEFSLESVISTGRTMDLEIDFPEFFAEIGIDEDRVISVDMAFPAFEMQATILPGAVIDMSCSMPAFSMVAEISIPVSISMNCSIFDMFTVTMDITRETTNTIDFDFPEFFFLGTVNNYTDTVLRHVRGQVQ